MIARRSMAVRPVRSSTTLRPMRLAVVAFALVVIPLAAGSTAAWETRAPMPLPRTEVVAATLGQEIVVLGGLTIGGGPEPGLTVSSANEALTIEP